MEILKLSILRGPNYWSNERCHLIYMKLDIGRFEDLPTNLLPHFSEKLITLIPTLYNHRCSIGIPGGFIERLKEGTWLGHVVEHVALELQWLAGMNCGFGRTRATDVKGVYDIVFSYEIEKAGIYAAESAVQFVKALIHSTEMLSVTTYIEVLKTIHSEERLGVSTHAIVEEAKKRNIPFHRVNNTSSLVILGHGHYQKKIWGAMTCDTSAIGLEMAADKYLTKERLAAADIPVPIGFIIQHESELEAVIEEIQFPITIKPINGNHGRGVTTHISNLATAKAAFTKAKPISHHLIVEKHIAGDDFRFLVINYKLIAVAKRIPAFIVGDGISTIKELIDLVNQDEKRGEGHDNYLTKIAIDQDTLSILHFFHYTLETILPANKFLQLKYTANLSSGGTAVDVTDCVHPENIILAERVASILKLDICGIDMIASNIHFPLTPANGAVVEVNAGPGLRMHLAPSAGKSRNVAKPIIDMLYPPNSTARIPIIAVTGTNGKTTTVRVIAHLAAMSGYKVGMACTDGIYINNSLIRKGDCSGPISARMILQDPTINFAVLECARGGILREGLGYDTCDIGIILNMTGDHLGVDGIETIEQLTRLKSVVARSVKKEGYTLLNADDDWVYAMKESLDSHVVLLSMQSDNLRIVEHCQQGGSAIYLVDNWITFRKGDEITKLLHVSDIPLTRGATSQGMIQNILASILVSILLEWDTDYICETLKIFYPTPANTPGRMNLFRVDNVNILLDYAHNVAAFKELKKYLMHIKSPKKIGIIAMSGDRAPDDIITIGSLSAEIFDEIIIRLEKDGRGRDPKQISLWLKEGIHLFNKNIPIKEVDDEHEALLYAIKNAKANDFITYLPTEVDKAIAYLKLNTQTVVSNLVEL